MTNKQRLEELKQQAKELTKQIEQLEDQINNTQPTSGLLGRWATNRDGKQVLITEDSPIGGWIETVYVTDYGVSCEKAEEFAHLTFPEQTTRPQDVPVGEAWLIDADDADDGYDSTTNAPAVKEHTGIWVTGEDKTGNTTTWTDYEVTLITPLIPARPLERYLERVVEGVRNSDGEGHAVEVCGVLIVKCDEYGVPLRRWPEQGLETVTTEEEYGALPEGSVTAKPGEKPWVHLPYMWAQSGDSTDNAGMAGTTRHVLRCGWGK